MEKNRREFIKTIALGMCGVSLVFGTSCENETYSDGFEVQKGFKVFNSKTQKNMEKLADVLVPGSKAVGIRDKFMKYIVKHKNLAVPLDSGLWNINSLSVSNFKKPFYSLENQTDIKNLVTYASKNIVFFSLFRTIVLKLYYTDSAVWKQLSYQGPPQPRGFMDYSIKPQQST